MRAVVTGGAGFIGSHLVDRLASAGWDVDVVDDLRFSRSFMSDDEEPEYVRDWTRRVRTVWKSVSEARPELERLDAVFHLASPVGPVGVLAEAGRIAPQVTADAASVVRWARRGQCPLVYVSTSEVYGSGHADSEADPCVFQPASSARKEYAVAKLAAETMLLNTPGLDVRIVRPFNVAGPRQRTDGGFVLPRFVAQALAGESLTVYQPGTQRRAFTHVSDIVTGLVAALERGRAGEVYNLGNPDNACSIWDLAAEVIEAVGHGTRELVDPQALWGSAFREAPDKLPDIRKARIELGWEPTLTRAEIIRDVVASHRVAVAA